MASRGPIFTSSWTKKPAWFSVSSCVEVRPVDVLEAVAAPTCRSWSMLGPVSNWSMYWTSPSTTFRLNGAGQERLPDVRGVDAVVAAQRFQNARTSKCFELRNAVTSAAVNGLRTRCR